MVVITIAIVTTLSLNMVAPSIPLIGAGFHISYARAQPVIGVFLLVYACALLVVTPVTARLGERMALTMALSVFTLGSVICMIAPDIWFLLVGRSLQAMGAAFGPVLARAIIRMRHEGAALHGHLANLATISAIVPVLAPILGGQLADMFGWRAIFMFLALFGMMAVMIVCLFFDLPRGGSVGANSNFRAQIAELIRQPAFIRGVCLLSVTYCAVYSFVSLGPTIFIHQIGLDTRQFSVVYGLSVCFYLGGTQLGTLKQRHLPPAIWCCVTVAGGVMVLAAHIMPFYQAMFWVLAGIAVFNLATGYMFPFAQSLLLSGAPRLSTAASSVGLFVQNASAALFSTAITMLAGIWDAHLPVFGLSLVAAGVMQLGLIRSVK